MKPDELWNDKIQNIVDGLKETEEPDEPGITNWGDYL